MQLQGVSVSGFRSLRNSHLSGLKVLNCVIGRNNAGKSALLDGLLLLPLIAVGHEHLQGVPLPGPADMDMEEWLEDSISDHELGKPLRVELDFVPGDEEMGDLRGHIADSSEVMRSRLMLHYALELRPRAPHWDRRRLYLLEVTLCSEGERMTVFRQRAGGEGGPPGPGVAEWADSAIFDAWLRGRSEPSQYLTASENYRTVMQKALVGGGRDEVRWFAQWVARLRHVRRDRHIDDIVSLDESPTLDADGSNLARFLQYLNTNETLRMRQLLAVFKRLIPWVDDVFTPLVGDKATTTRVAIRPEQDVGEAFALSNMGSGAIHVMIVAAMIWSMPDGGLALVEEPETGIHATAQRDLLRFLREHCRATGKQVIFASHSPLFARVDADMASFVTLYEPAGGTTFRPLEAGGQGAVLAELGARMSDYFGYNAILLIEGETEEAALPPILDALEIDLETEGIGVVVLRGSVAQRLTRAKEVVGMLAGTQTAPFVLVDADPGVPEKLAELEQQEVISGANWWTWKKEDEGPGEFEDNFTGDELVAAANGVAQEAGQAPALQASEFEKRQKQTPAKKTSAVLLHYYWDTYQHGLSKPRLGHFLGQAAAEAIRSGGAKREQRYQFEEALERLEALLPK